MARLGALATAALAATALARVVTVKPPMDTYPATADDLRAVFAAISADEPSTRATAAQSFPGDAWSQDDDFHEHEQKRARSVAAERGIRLGDALRALDDGLREGWPSSASGHLQPGVPPCRPRLSY